MTDDLTEALKWFEDSIEIEPETTANTQLDYDVTAMSHYRFQQILNYLRSLPKDEPVQLEVFFYESVMCGFDVDAYPVDSKSFYWISPKSNPKHNYKQIKPYLGALEFGYFTDTREPFTLRFRTQPLGIDEVETQDQVSNRIKLESQYPTTAGRAYRFLKNLFITVANENKLGSHGQIDATGQLKSITNVSADKLDDFNGQFHQIFTLVGALVSGSVMSDLTLTHILQEFQNNSRLPPEYDFYGAIILTDPYQYKYIQQIMPTKFTHPEVIEATRLVHKVAPKSSIHYDAVAKSEYNTPSKRRTVHKKIASLLNNGEPYQQEWYRYFCAKNGLRCWTEAYLNKS